MNEGGRNGAYDGDTKDWGYEIEREHIKALTWRNEGSIVCINGMDYQDCIWKGTWYSFLSRITKGKGTYNISWTNFQDRIANVG